MKLFHMAGMKGGWFIGDFLPSAYKTEKFEVGHKIHKKGEPWDIHYHKCSTEITFLIKGKMLIQDKQLVTGDIFIMEPYEVADPVFMEDCEVVVIKVPSVPGDKHIIKSAAEITKERT